MAKSDTQFKPGVSGNPGGRPKLPEHLRKIAELSGAEVKRIIAKFGRMKRVEVEKFAADSNSTMLEITIASIFLKSADQGDYARLAFLLDRSIGKPQPEPPADSDTDTSGMTTDEKIQWLKARMKPAPSPN